MRVLVCGGRDYSDKAFVHWVLDVLHQKKRIDLVIHGCARGADTFAEEWASTIENCTSYGVPADWNKHGKAAGPIRNGQMLEFGKPDLVVAFAGGAGTADMVAQATKAGVKVLQAETLRSAFEGLTYGFL